MACCRERSGGAVLDPVPARAGDPHPAVLESLPLMSVSGVANLLFAVKLAKYYEMGTRDVVVTMATDSMDM